MLEIGDKDEQGYVCRYIKGPIAIWEVPDGGFGIYMAVKDKEFMGTIYNHLGNYDDSVLVADKTFDKLNQYGKTILT